jgi:hypothetical protein
VKREDPAQVFISMTTSGTPAIAVLDPLCPACKGFDERVSESGLDKQLAIDAVLFPLDSTCNWMVKDSMHPGACAVSEAMLCALKDSSQDSLKILDWARSGYLNWWPHRSCSRQPRRPRHPWPHPWPHPQRPCRTEDERASRTSATATSPTTRGARCVG